MRPDGIERVASRAARVRVDITFAIVDAFVVASAYLIVVFLRFNGVIPSRYRDGVAAFLPVAIGVHLFANWAMRLYGRIWRYASVDEARRVVGASLLAGGVLLTSQAMHLTAVPQSVVVLGLPIATLLVGAVRFRSRLFSFSRSTDQRFGLRIAVMGSGGPAATIVREMLDNPDAGLVPVVVLDDDPRAAGRSLMGLPIAGDLEALPHVVDVLNVHQALLAASSDDGQLVRRAARIAEEAGVALKIVPTVKDLVGGQPALRSAREVRIEDLLGREQVATDLDAVRRLLKGRRVLITGAGGSIGSEISRQVSGFDPAELLLLDHDETHLHDVAPTLSCSAELVLADIRDEARIRAIFDRAVPEVVFHAAAHKHVDLLEHFPIEGFETNVLGSLHVVRAAVDAGVSCFVYISTDKAVRPASVMGASKRLGGEILLTHAPPHSRYCVVRFGNVFGSRGSVIPTFERQIAAGGPVTVTDPRMTRFFMSVEEAVQLVLQAAVLAQGGDAFMLEMGEPVNILELAKRMVRLSGYSVGTDIPIRISGVRPGEKLVEELRADDEDLLDAPHPSILRLRPSSLSWPELEAGVDQLRALADAGDDAGVAHLLIRLANASTQSSDPVDVIDLVSDSGASVWNPSSI